MKLQLTILFFLFASSNASNKVEFHSSYGTLTHDQAGTTYWKLNIDLRVYRETKDLKNSFNRRIIKHIVKQNVGAQESSDDSDSNFDSVTDALLHKGVKRANVNYNILTAAGESLANDVCITDRNGVYNGNTIIHAETLPANTDLYIETADGTPSRSSKISLLSPHGLSVISDIDDTIKITEVTNVNQMIQNTLNREFRTVPGMSELYQSWQHIADFHYLSSSPWQLYNELNKFLRKFRFPAGTIHLRKLSELATYKMSNKVKNWFVKTGLDPYKPNGINGIMTDFPQRKFVLIGDSGEHDPEVYATIAELPGNVDRIECIFIRRLGTDITSMERMEQVFQNIPPHKWFLFTNPVDLHTHPCMRNAISNEHQRKQEIIQP
eukprot:Pgem_evm1s18324